MKIIATSGHVLKAATMRSHHLTSYKNRNRQVFHDSDFVIDNMIFNFELQNRPTDKVKSVSVPGNDSYRSGRKHCTLDGETLIEIKINQISTRSCVWESPYRFVLSVSSHPEQISSSTAFTMSSEEFIRSLDQKNRIELTAQQRLIRSLQFVMTG